MNAKLLPPHHLTPLAECAILAGRVPTKQEYKTWVTEGVSVYSSDTISVEVPDGFMTDFASIPFMFRWWQTGSLGPQRIGSYFHDFMYSGTNKFSRKEADLAFRKIMQMVGRGPRRWAQRWIMWSMVRLWGWAPYWIGQRRFKKNPNYRILMDGV